jgi:hypothetical protein
MDVKAIRLCQHCGVPLTEGKRRDARYCSGKCKGTAQGRRYRAAIRDGGSANLRNGRRKRHVSAIEIYDDDPEIHVGLVELTQGKYTKVSLADMGKVMHHPWYFSSGYAVREQDGKRIYMHRVILGLPPGRHPEVDHRNFDTLDNRRQNLRVATRAQQMGHRREFREGTSRFRGVRWDVARQKWRAEIIVNYRYRFLGRFDDEIEAARAYDRAALEAWGEFATINGV